MEKLVLFALQSREGSGMVWRYGLPKTKKAFNNDVWIADDGGQGIDNKDIDLYLGDADPLPGSKFVPIFSFSEANDVPVVFSKYPTP